jgi:hypothetical protein
MLIEKCIGLFGLDDFGKGSLKREHFEKIELGKDIRSWTIFKVVVGLLLVDSEKNGNRICLSIQDSLIP